MTLVRTSWGGPSWRSRRSPVPVWRGSCHPRRSGRSRRCWWRPTSGTTPSKITKNISRKHFRDCSHKLAYLRENVGVSTVIKLGCLLIFNCYEENVLEWQIGVTFHLSEETQGLLVQGVRHAGLGQLQGNFLLSGRLRKYRRFNLRLSLLAATSSIPLAGKCARTSRK